MIKKKPINFYAPVCLFILMLIDGQLSRVFENITKMNYLGSFHFLILAFLLASQSLSKKHLMITALVLGLIYDIYYTGIIGIYALIFVVVVYFLYLFKEVIHQNIFTEFFAMVIFVTFFELAAFLIQLLFRLTDTSQTFFIASYLAPTLLINMVVFIVFYFPLKKLFVKK
jgi:rod shape-determining protein MreC/rod shape-determining protein MreD